MHQSRNGNDSKLDVRQNGGIDDDEDIKDKEIERGQWSGKLDFLLSCLGYAVGLGNIWRFPHLCYKHGGGAFLLPYTLMLFIIGFPCFFLELQIGQYSALGPITIYSQIAPLFKGLGIANFVASAFVALYYNMIIAWTIYYIFASMASPLPWISCDNDFNSPFCFSVENYRVCNESRSNGNISAESIYHNGSCISERSVLDAIRRNKTFYYGCEVPTFYLENPNDTCSIMKNESNKEPGIYIDSKTCVALSKLDQTDDKLFDIPVKKRQSSSAEYLKHAVLNESPDGISDLNGVQWHLALSLLAAWIVIFLCLFKGIKSSGKVVYFTATFPYLILVILFFRAITLEGSLKGIQFYIIPKWDRLMDAEVWKDAAAQIFFSLSVGGGGLITLASYNSFHNNIVRDTLIVCFGNCLTSFFAGFAIFGVLGFLAEKLGVEVDEVVKGSTGLAFEAYPDLVSQLPLPTLWAILFFIMLFTLGLDSQFAITETLLTGILDYKPHWRKYKIYVVGTICSIGFLLGLPLTTRGGTYLLDILDNYAANWPYLFIGMTELLLMSYVYGIENFLDDIKHVCDVNLNAYFRSYFITIITFLSPLVIFIILLLSFIGHTGLARGDYVFPPEAVGFGLFISVVIMGAMPLVAVITFIREFASYEGRDDFLTKMRNIFKKLLTPTAKWRKNALEQAALDSGRAEAAKGIENFGAVTDVDTSQL